MGMFSWKCCCCNEAINAGTHCGALTPDGNHLYEADYEGYGVFGGRDVYALVSEWNHGYSNTENLPDREWDRSIRLLGIDIACSDEENRSLEFPIKIVCGRCIQNESDLGKLVYANMEHSDSDPNQGFNTGSYETEAEIEEREKEETCWGCGNDLRYYDCECE